MPFAWLADAPSACRELSARFRVTALSTVWMLPPAIASLAVAAPVSESLRLGQPCAPIGGGRNGSPPRHSPGCRTRRYADQGWLHRGASSESCGSIGYVRSPGGWPSQDIFSGRASPDPVARLERVEGGLDDIITTNEAQLRLMLASSLAAGDRRRRQSRPARQTRRSPLIAAALAGARRELDRLQRLGHALPWLSGPTPWWSARTCCNWTRPRRERSGAEASVPW